MSTEKAKPMTAKTMTAKLNLDTKLNLEADRFHQLGLETAKANLFKPDPLTERLAREHFVRAETYRTAAKLAEGN